MLSIPDIIMNPDEVDDITGAWFTVDLGDRVIASGWYMSDGSIQGTAIHLNRPGCYLNRMFKIVPHLL